MTRPARERPALSRFALCAWVAWIALAATASLLPFLVEVRLWTPSGHAFWACRHGCVYRVSVHRPTVSTELKEHRNLVAWNPGTSASIQFEWGPSRTIIPRPSRLSQPFVRCAPPWAVLLMPTLLVIVLARPTRWLARNFPRWVARWFARVRDWQSAERRALLAAGRTPCPNCDYDVTGLERCPECGTLARAVRTTPLRRLRPTRLALVLWLGLAGAAALMPFLFEMYWSSGPFDAGGGQGTFFIGYEHSYQNWAKYRPSNGVDLRPGLLHMFTFDAGWSHNFKYVQFPPWLVVLVPTLVALTIRRELRFYKRRTLAKLGRTPCPACQYDATGLEVCPECGTAIKTTP